MARSRFVGLAVVTVALLLTCGQLASAQYSTPPSGTTPTAQTTPYASPSYSPAQTTPYPSSSYSTANTPKAPLVANESTCVVYPLAGLGDDPDVGKWIAETIPEMIQPGTWSAEPWRRVSYYAPGKLLVVRHTPAVHAQVAAFLKDFQKALPTPKPATSTARAATTGPVLPAQYTADHVRTADPAPSVRPNNGYPIPAPLQQPKHLFHLVIRYEGDGISDATVAGLVKELSQAGADKDAGAKPEAEPAKGPSLGQLLHFIVRYEGEGIIDSNVAALLKDIYGAQKRPDFPLGEQLTAPPGTTVAPSTPKSSPKVAVPPTSSAAPAVPPATQGSPLLGTTSAVTGTGR